MNLTGRDGGSLTSIVSEGGGITKFQNFKVRVIKMYLKEAYMQVHIGKYLQPIQKGPKQGYVLLSLFFNFALEYTILGGCGIIKFKVYLNKSYKMFIYVNIFILCEMV